SRFAWIVLVCLVIASAALHAGAADEAMVPRRRMTQLPEAWTTALAPLVIPPQASVPAELNALPDLIQATLSDATAVRWIDRADVKRAAGELHLSTGLGGADVPLRIGRWVRAELLVQ